MIMANVVKFPGNELYRWMYSDAGVFIYDPANVSENGYEHLEPGVLLPLNAKHNYIESRIHFAFSERDMNRVIRKWDEWTVERGLVVRRGKNGECVLEHRLFD